MVTVSPTQAGITLSVTETNKDGFKVVSSAPIQGATFNWIAMAKVPAAQVLQMKEPWHQLLNQLKVDADKKAAIHGVNTGKHRSRTANKKPPVNTRNTKIVKAGKENYMPTTGIPAKVEEK